VEDEDRVAAAAEAAAKARDRAGWVAPRPQVRVEIAFVLAAATECRTRPESPATI